MTSEERHTFPKPCIFDAIFITQGATAPGSCLKQYPAVEGRIDPLRCGKEQKPGCPGRKNSMSLERFEDILQIQWGMRGPLNARVLREDQYRRTWWMDTANGPIMIKWLGEPGQQDLAAGSLRLLHYATTQGAPTVQVIPTREGAAYCTVHNGILAVFECVDAAWGTSDWKALGRAVGRLHAVPLPEFARRSPISPGGAIPAAMRNFQAFVADAGTDHELVPRARKALGILKALPPMGKLAIGVVHTDLGIAHTITRTTGEITFLDTLDIGIAPLSFDLPAVICEHLSHLDSHGAASGLNTEAARQFFIEYTKYRPVPDEERNLMLSVHQAYHIILAARYLDIHRRTGEPQMLASAKRYFDWLDYAEVMVPRDLIPLLTQ